MHALQAKQLKSKNVDFHLSIRITGNSEIEKGERSKSEKTEEKRGKFEQ